MAEVKRAYDADRRRQQARARRLAVVRAARELFERDGFRQTTITAIAAAAGVSAESVYKNFGSKANVAKAVFDLVIAGDDEPVPIAQRPASQAMREEPDVRTKIALFVDGLAQRQAQSAKVQILIRDGRHVDDSLAPIWAKPNDEDPPPRSARGDPRDPPGLGSVRTRPPRGLGRRRSRQALPVPAGRPHARSRRSPVRYGP